jgi:O-antigen/teichoic acid export membrane protein
MTHESISRIRRNSILNVLGGLAPIAVALVTVPLYLDTIGTARYGVLAVIWVLLTYFRVFDLGLGRATANQVARLGEERRDEGAAVVWTALALNTGLGVLGGLSLLGVGYPLIAYALDIPTQLRDEALDALPFLAATVPLLTITAVLQGALEGRERFGTVNLIETGGLNLSQLLPLALAVTVSPELPWLIAGAAIATALTAVAWFAACRRLVLAGTTGRYDRTLTRSLFSYGGWVTVTGLVSPLLEVIDRIIIGIVSGAVAVAAYAISFNLASRILLLPHALIRAAFPRLSFLEPEAARALAGDALRGLVLVLTPAVIVALVGLRPFLELWIGEDIARDAAPVGEILLVGVWLNGLAFIPYALLQAQGRPDVPAKFHVAELLPFLALLWILLETFGVEGAAVAWAVRAGADALLLGWAAGALRLGRREVAIGAGGVTLAALGAFTVFSELEWRALLGGALTLAAIFWAWRRSNLRLRPGVLVRRRRRT